MKPLSRRSFEPYLKTESKTYISAEDSRLLRRASGYFSGNRCLEIGVGYGSNLLELCNSFNDVTGTDIERTEGFLRASGANFVISDAGSCFRDGTFDLILLNPPYLPSDEIEDLAVDGGKFGLDVASKFLAEAARLVSSSGKILLVLSSLNSKEQLALICKSLGLYSEPLETESVFFESLTVYELFKTGRLS